jgi:hypothetical protein
MSLDNINKIKIAKLHIFQTLIISRLSYCDNVYGPAILQRDSNRLQLIQNSCIRFAYRIRKFDHISSKFEESGWLRLEKLRKSHIISLTHKILNCGQPFYLASRLVVLRGRNKHSLLIPRSRSLMYNRSFSYAAAKSYNSIPTAFKHYSLYNFKKKLKAWLT